MSSRMKCFGRVPLDICAVDVADFTSSRSRWIECCVRYSRDEFVVEYSSAGVASSTLQLFAHLTAIRNHQTQKSYLENTKHNKHSNEKKSEQEIVIKKFWEKIINNLRRRCFFYDNLVFLLFFTQIKTLNVSPFLLHVAVVNCRWFFFQETVKTRFARKTNETNEKKTTNFLSLRHLNWCFNENFHIPASTPQLSLWHQLSCFNAFRTRYTHLETY